jgi:hypothetical protein
LSQFAHRQPGTSPMRSMCSQASQRQSRSMGRRSKSSRKDLRVDVNMGASPAVAVTTEARLAPSPSTNAPPSVRRTLDGVASQPTPTLQPGSALDLGRFAHGGC